MTTLFTVLALAVMIGACALLIQFANARHTVQTTAEAHRWRLQWRRSTVRRTGQRP
ncbi:hypothetical protein ABH931_003965 [Streptacidiphilus sp. MAP12-33]|uniref:hypothetical protein n=1 Tax=Streptacidiphilus sp. MAP12-33 TaxID=3156266 RepID=UPI003518C81D